VARFPHHERNRPRRGAARRGAKAWPVSSTSDETATAMRTEIARDRAVASLAAIQHGVVTAAQLDAAGFTDPLIRRRVAGGWLVRRHQGVFQLGVVPGRLGDEMAALLAVGPRAVLSHRTAVKIWRLAHREGERGRHVRR